MASAISTAIAGLCAALSASSDLTGVTVHDGPPVTAETPDWIAVGYQPGTVNAVQAKYDWAQLGARKQEETFDILCCLMTSSGDLSMVTRRDRAIALRDAVAAAISADYTLGGAVRVAHMTAADLLQEQTDRGALAGFTFTISAAVRISQ